MRYKIIPGELNGDLFNNIISISSVRSEKVIRALYDYFVLGFSRREICDKNSINPGYLSIKIREFHEFYKKICALLHINN